MREDLTKGAIPRLVLTDDDLSEGKIGSDGKLDVSALIDEDIKDRKQYRTFRNWTFGCIVLLIAVLVIMFAGWTGFFGWRLLTGSYDAGHSPVALFLTPIVIIATLVAVLMLATMRFVFRQSGEKEGEKDGLTIWQALVKELSDVLKQYVAKK